MAKKKIMNPPSKFYFGPPKQNKITLLYIIQNRLDCLKVTKEKIIMGNITQMQN